MTFTEYEKLLKYLGNEHTDQFIKYHYSLVHGELKVEKDVWADIPEQSKQEFLDVITIWKRENLIS